MNLKRECHRRRRLHSHALLASLALASAGLAACGDNHGEDSPDLQAILHDGDLTEVMRGMLKAPPPTTGTAGTSGTMAGSGGSSGIAGSTGTTGAAGRMPPPSGSAGISGIAGSFGGPGMAGSFAGSFGTAGNSMGGGDGGVTRNFPGEAQGFWRFDDCNMDRTELFDSSFIGNHTAFRSVTAFCRPGILNSGVGFDEDDDMVLVPDQPNFVFSEGFTVAAWVKPTDLGGVRTIFRKRLDGTSTFVLAENGNNYQIVINLANGKAADVQAKATLDKFTHVAATFDGIFLRLYLDGVEAASKRVVGRLADGGGPLLMGNDANKRHIAGVIDSVVFDTVPASPAEIAKLTCLPRPSVMSVTPTDPAAVLPETPVAYDIQITNNSCEDGSFNFNAFPATFITGLTVQPNFGFAFVPATTTAHVPFTVTAAKNIEDAGTFPISVNAELFSQFTFEQFNQTVNFSVIDTSTPCTIKPRRELEIRDVSVVDDPIRTGPNGAWTFGKLMQDMAPTPADAPAMVEGMLRSFLSDQTINGFSVPSRFGMQQVLDSMRGPNGTLDLSATSKTFRLLAIVNRIDLNDATPTTATTAGEGRFVFGFAPFGQTLSATLIVEYAIPAGSPKDVSDLAAAWHALRQLQFPSPQYNAALQAVTERFTARGAGGMGRVNGSALGQIRTNDFFQFGGVWEFREFHLDATSGMLIPATVDRTPDRSFNFSDTLGRFVLANEPAILAEKHTVPASFEGAPFQGGNVDASDFFRWQVPGVSQETRHRFARNTCNGCHTFDETGGAEFQVRPRGPGQESSLSGFLTGQDVDDFPAGVRRHFNELDRRGRLLHAFVCPQEMLPPPPPDTTPLPGGTAGTGGGMGGFGGSFMPPPRDGGIGGTTGAAGVFGGGPDAGVSGAGGARGM
jgi:hypothetical protein